jgi:predicted TIM-barrel fold metal-dependent hydrolase
MNTESGPSMFDSHVHILPKGRLKGLMRWIHKAMPGHPVAEGVTAEEITGQLKGHSIRECFNLVYPLFTEETDHINNWNLDFCQASEGIHPVCSLHIETPEKEKTAEDLFQRGSLGIKFHPFIQKFNPSHESFTSLYRLMNSMKMPLFLHTGYDDWYGDSFPVSDIESIVSAYPDMPVILVHMIFPHIKEAFQLLKNNGNVILDCTNVPGSFIYAREKNIPLPKELVENFISGIEKNSTRVMYGSDHPVGMGSLEDIYRDLAELNLSAEAYDDVTGSTARKLLKTTKQSRGKIL